MGNLVSRVVIGAPLALATLLTVWVGGWLLVVFVAVVVLIATHELYAMARAYRPMVIAGQLGACGMVIGAYAGGARWVLYVVPITLLVAFLLAAGVAMRESATASIAVTVLGCCYIGIGGAALVLLRGSGPGRFGVNAAFAVLLGVWASDIAAYAGGRLIGRHKLAPAISPTKTMEGFLIGAAFGAIAVWWTLYTQKFFSHVDAAILGVVIALVAPFGDLFESFLKRDLGVKDSGRLLGGHGGMLDRVDALLLAAPAALVVIDLVSRA